MRTNGLQKILHEFSVDDPNDFGIVLSGSKQKYFMSRTKTHALNLVNLDTSQLVLRA